MGFVKLLFPIAVVVALTSGLAQAWGQRHPAADLSSMDIEQLMQVNVAAASLHSQRLEDAPASVTIITQDDIRKYGYRTLAEALSGARGFFTSYDHTYHFEGVRGFSLPGDYGTRLLVMVNGHSMTDNILGQATWYGQDMALDMTLVKQIEIVRGPSSALYGSSGLFATINIVTLSPDEFKNTKVTAETGSFGEKKIQAATAVSLGHGAAMLFSGSILNNSGEHSLYFPEANSPANNFGRAIDVDGEKGYHLFADFAWHDWRVTSLFGARQKIQPISWGPTIFGDPGSRALDSRNFVEATYTHNFDSSRSLQWRTFYDSYRFRGVFRYQEDVVADNRVFFTGDWVGSQVNYRFPLPHIGSLTVGGWTVRFARSAAER